MKKKIPKIDLPDDWVIYTGVNQDFFEKYSDHPVRLKCELLLLCMEGEIEATVNISRTTAKANDLIILTPGSILQIHRVNNN